jgi:CPA2 family monovalent cation:H+ antiporter-2
MHNLDLILILAAGFIAALVFGYVCQRLRTSPMVGYLLAGVLIGPNTPGLAINRQLAEQLSEVGVILLMFGVGLHFHLRDLIAVRRVAVTGALFRSSIAVLTATFAYRALGWTWPSSLVMGFALSVASTVVLIRVLGDAGALQSPTWRVAVGWVIVEDIFTVLLLVLLPVLFQNRGPLAQDGVGAAVLMAAVKVAVFVGFTLLAGSRFVPWLLSRIAETRSRELFTLGVLSVALGIAVGSALLFGVSMALGAFLAGMVVGQSEFSARAGSEAIPMRDAFAVMFFLSVGMLLDPRQALESPAVLAVTLAIVFVVRPLAAFFIMIVLGIGSRVATAVSLALAQIGEFSFLMAGVGRQIGVLDATAMNVLVLAAVVSILLSPALFRLATPIEAAVASRPRLWAALNRRSSLFDSGAHAGEEAPRAIVVGHGPIGQTVCRILRQRGIEPTIIEMNVETFRRLRAEGQRVVYGDSNRPEVLAEAGVSTAASLILSASGSAGSTETVRLSREMNPRIHVVARADYLSEVPALKAAGANEVISGEGEVAVMVASSLLRLLGATPEQAIEAQEQLRAQLEKAVPAGRAKRPA